MSSSEVGYFEKTGYMGPCATYLAGVVAGDGGIYPRGNSWSLALRAFDRDFVEEFRRCAEAVKGESVPKIEEYSPGAPSNPDGKKTKYVFQCGWTRWQEILSGKISDKCRCDWLRGMFDSEGGVEYNLSHSHREISFSNSNLATLKQVKEMLLAEGIQLGKPTRTAKKGDVNYWKGQKFEATKDCFQPRVSGQQNLERFRAKIGFDIQRQQAALEEMLSTYRYRTGVTVAEVVNLRFNQKKAYAEIAQELGCNKSVVYRRLRQAKHREKEAK